MPFERYLDAAPHALDDPGHGVDGAGLDASMFSANVQFQVPSLILGQPTLAPDGGAEVLPPAFLAHSSPYPHAPCPDSAFASHPGHTAYFHPAYAPALAYPSYTHHRPPAYNPGLYAYSATGFDILDILSRVKNRPNPVVPLGPVDLTCAFTIADVRRPDAPIVYASPAFCALTGYAEHEILHRNCRFLQAPDARVAPGEPRRHPSAPAVAYMRSALAAGKECQATVINYRKGGAAFVNLVTVIPLLGGVHGSPDEADTVAFHVGFQVDLGAQPAAILAKLHDGTYATDLSRPAYSAPPTAIAPRNWRAAATAMRGVSDTLHALLEDPKFRCSLPPALDAVYVPPSAAAAPAATPSPPAEGDGNHSLHLALLAAAPDFVHVLSLKGAFLYVAPAVTHVLGYAPADLVGRSLADLCHPADVVPLMRELKESSVTPGPGSMHAHLYAEQGGGGGGGGGTGPRKVDLLFRMPTKAGKLVWLECRGRLHVEPGKGRKAIILSGRVRAMPRLAWGAVARAGGLSPPVPVPRDASGAESDGEECETECWALLSARGTLLFAAAAVRDVAGWGAGEVIGRPVRELLGPADAVEGELARVCAPEGSAAGEARSVQCHLRTKDGARVPVRVVLYRAQDDVAADADASPVVCQIRMSDVDTGSAARLVHAPSESVFAELAAARASSWQYELQQLKYANQRLAEDVAALEQRLQQSRVQIPEHLQLPPLEHARHHQLHLPPLPVHSQHPPQMQLQLPPLATPAMPQYAQQYPPPRLALQLPPPPYPNAAVLPELSYSAPPREQDWRHDASQALLDLWQDPVQSHDPAGVPRYGLKRSRDDAEGGT